MSPAFRSFLPTLTPLEPRDVPATSLLAVGADAGGGPRVTLFDRADDSVIRDFFAYEESFTGGVRVGVGDFTRDGTPDVVTAPGAGGGPRIRIFDGKSGESLRDFFVFDPGFVGGVNVAVGDATGDGVPDILAGAGSGGGPRVTLVDGKTGETRADFFAFEPTFSGGVTVALGDVNRDGRAELVVGAGPGGSPVVKVFDAAGGLLTAVTAFAPEFTGGVNVAAADLTGDGKAELVVGAGPGGGPAVNLIDVTTTLSLGSFFAFDESFGGGVRVAAAGTGGGRPEVIVAPGSGGGRQVRLLRGLEGAASPLVELFEPGYNGGAFVAAESLAARVTETLGTDVLPFDLGEAAGPTVATLRVKPLDINLLGLTLQTDEIVVTITAVPGSGKLLGNALTAAANLVNLGGVSDALNRVLDTTIDLLNDSVLAVDGLAGGTLNAATGSGTTSILDLNVAPIRIDLLGVRIETSPIRLNLSATAGDGLVLGNVLTSLTDLFNPPLPDRLDLNFVNERLAKLLSDLETQLPGFDASGGSALEFPPPAGAREVLNLSVPPIDLSLLGLLLRTDRLNVNADALSGDGRLLGNVLTLLLDTAEATPEQISDLNANLNGILNKVVGVLNASRLTLPDGALESLTGPLQSLALPDLVGAEPGSLAPVLDLSIATPDASTPPVAVDLLGLVVTTSNVNVQLAAQTGDGLLLGNLIYNVSHLLDPDGSVAVLRILNGLTQ